MSYLYSILPNPINKIFIDLDDTLVDFLGSVHTLFYGTSFLQEEKDWEQLISKITSDGGASMWGKINKRGSEWWASLPKLPWADDLWSICNSVCSNVSILTAHSLSPSAAAGKVMWAERNFGAESLIVTRAKHMCSYAGSILIDDYTKNREPWEKHGGIFIQIKTEWVNGGFTPGEIISALLKYKHELRNPA